jgi:hypothetical protein
MDIAAQSQKILPLLDQQTLITPLQEMPTAFMPPGQNAYTRADFGWLRPRNASLLCHWRLREVTPLGCILTMRIRFVTARIRQVTSLGCILAMRIRQIAILSCFVTMRIRQVTLVDCFVTIRIRLVTARIRLVTMRIRQVTPLSRIVSGTTH